MTTDYRRCPDCAEWHTPTEDYDDTRHIVDDDGDLLVLVAVWWACPYCGYRDEADRYYMAVYADN